MDWWIPFDPFGHPSEAKEVVARSGTADDAVGGTIVIEATTNQGDSEHESRPKARTAESFHDLFTS
jgi:hypothetical protein